jgi:zinc ribbon protein
MAAQFCSNCGVALPTGARFCLSCGNPIPGAAAPASPAPPQAVGYPSSPPVAAPSPPPPSSLPSLGQVLGLEGCRNFLLQHQWFTQGRNYRVLNHEKRHLFTVVENAGQELWANLFQSRQPPKMGFSVQFGAAPRTFVWAIDGPNRTRPGLIQIQMHGMSAEASVVDAAGTPVLSIHIKKGMMGGLDATAAFPDGRPMFEAKGNLLRHSFQMLDPSGQAIAKIHEAFISTRDTYNIDVVGPVDPLYPLLLAVMIDREKELNKQG